MEEPQCGIIDGDMLSKMCKTGIKAVVYLCSRKADNEYIGIKQIADAIDSSEHTVGKLLQTLVRNDIIGSLKGPAGGYFITKEQCRLPILKIVDAVDGCAVFRECGLGLSACSSDHPCPLHHLYGPIRDALLKIFSEKRIQDLCSEVDSGEAFLAG